MSSAQTSSRILLDVACLHHIDFNCLHCESNEFLLLNDQLEDKGKIYLIAIKYYVGTDMFGLRSNLITLLKPINPFSVENGITNDFEK